MTNLVTGALAEGLKPRADTLSIRDATLLAIDAKLSRLERLHERTAQAAEDQAVAMQTFVALFASCIGVTTAWCLGEPDSSPAVNYLRSGDGKPFRCDAEVGGDV